MWTTAARLMAAALTAALLAGCGAGDPARHQIATYLSAVNRIERRLTAPLQTVDMIARQVAYHAAHPHSRAPYSASSQVQALTAAGGQIRAAAAALAALPAPAPAAHLKALLVSLVARQAYLTVQTRRLIAFAPAFPAILRPLGPAVASLEHVLALGAASSAAAATRVYAEKAAALRSFAAALSLALLRLSRLVAPDASRPVFDAEARSLRRMRVAALTLAGDLAARRATGLTPVLDAFDRAAALPGSRAVQAAGIAAARAYDRRVTQLNAIVGAIEDERLALAGRYR